MSRTPDRLAKTHFYKNFKKLTDAQKDDLIRAVWNH